MIVKPWIQIPAPDTWLFVVKLYILFEKIRINTKEARDGSAVEKVTLNKVEKCKTNITSKSVSQTSEHAKVQNIFRRRTKEKILKSQKS